MYERCDDVVSNGINGVTGDYWLPPQPPSVLSAIAGGQPIDPAQLDELRRFRDRSVVGDLGPFDRQNLAQAGWGVIFASNAPPQLREAMDELLQRRRMQASMIDERLYREFVGADGYQPGDTKETFLGRYKVGIATPDPLAMPYYLLLVGTPEQIPYSFQYQLDIQYAVGRIAFDDIAEYALYARSVVKAEETLRLPRTFAFFGPENPGDIATRGSSANLIQPLSQALMDDTYTSGTWTFQTLTGEQATKRALSTILCGGRAPALLFTASHGLAFPKGDPQQDTCQGAILCQDWPGRLDESPRPVLQDHYFAAADVPSAAAGLHGSITFHFACYSAGTPSHDDFWQSATQVPTAIANRSFISALPRRLLAQPCGGALAVVGHVDRAWSCSFQWGRDIPQISTFKLTLQLLMEGSTIGAALDCFGLRYAELSSDLFDMVQQFKSGDDHHRTRAYLWTARNDARNYILLGDPAVRTPAAPP